MKEQLYKNIALTFIAINVWTLYCFFDYYYAETHDKFNLSGLTLYFNFFNSVNIAIITGILAIILRATIFRKKKKPILKNNPFYVLIGFFNLNLLIIWIITISMGFLPLKDITLCYMIGILSITFFILFDIFQKTTSEIELDKSVP